MDAESSQGGSYGSYVQSSSLPAYVSSSSSMAQLSPTGEGGSSYGRVPPASSQSWNQPHHGTFAWSPDQGQTFMVNQTQHIHLQDGQYSPYSHPQNQQSTCQAQYQRMSPREHRSPLLPPFEPSRGPPELAQNHGQLLNPSAQQDPTQWDEGALVRPSHPLPDSGDGQDRSVSRSAAWAILASQNEFRLRPRLSSSASQPYTPARPAELSPNWAAVSSNGMAPQDYFGSCRSSISSSSYATSPSTTSFSISTPTVADSPVTPLKSLDDFAGFTLDVHTGRNKDGTLLLPFPVLPDTNEPDLARCVKSVGHSCLSCKKNRRKCQTPNINTRCLFCFQSNLACGYAEQKVRKEGKKEVDPSLPQLERWSLKEGLDASPPLVTLCNSESETSRLLHRKYVSKSKPNSDPFTFVTCAKAIELLYAVRMTPSSGSSSSSSYTSSLPPTTAPTPISTPIALPSAAIARTHSQAQRLGLSPLYVTTPIASSSRPSSASTSSSSLYTPATSASYTPGYAKPPPMTRTDSYPNRATRAVYVDSASMVDGHGRLSREGSKRRKTNPDGMMAMGMIGLGIDSGDSTGARTFGVEIGSPGRGG